MFKIVIITIFLSLILLTGAVSASPDYLQSAGLIDAAEQNNPELYNLYFTNPYVEVRNVEFIPVL